MSDKWIPNPEPFPSRPPNAWPEPTPNAPSVPTEEPEPEPRPGNVKTILGVVAVALVAAILAYVAVRVIRPPKQRVASPATSTVPPSTSTSTTTTLPSGPVVTQAQLDQLAASLVPFIERTRQLRFTTVPRPLLTDDATYRKAFQAQIANDDPLMARLTSPFRVLGLNPNDVKLPVALRAFYGSKTVVFYDAKHDLVRVRAVPSTPYLSAMLVVAMTEQLDDQHFRTDAMLTPKGFGDGVIGLRTLVQGDAWRIATDWIATRSTAEQNQVRTELAARRGADSDTTRVPGALAAWLRMPVDLGVTYTENLVTSTSSDPLNAAFRNPPDGSAQVSMPARLAAPIPQLRVAVPSVQGKVLASGTFGQFFLNEMLRTVVDPSALPIAISGYRGDSLVAYSKGEGVCVRMDVSVGNSSVTNLRDAMSAWAEKRTGKVSLHPDVLRKGRQVIRLDACTPGAGQSGDSTTTMPSRGSISSTTLPGRPKP